MSYEPDFFNLLVGVKSVLGVGFLFSIRLEFSFVRNALTLLGRLLILSRLNGGIELPLVRDVCGPSSRISEERMRELTGVCFFKTSGVVASLDMVFFLLISGERGVLSFLDDN